MYDTTRKVWHLTILVLIICITMILAGCSLFTPPAPRQFSLTGIISNTVNNLGLENVTLQFTSKNAESPFRFMPTTQPGATTSNSQGKYSKNALVGEVVVQPVKQGWSFSPTSRVVNANTTTADFTATPVSSQTYPISGRITDGSGTGLSGVTVAFGGGYTSVTTDINGNWSKSDLAGTVVVTPSKTGWLFNPTSKQVTTATTNVNFTAEPTPPPTYACSGKVTSADGSGLAGVLISFGAQGSTTTSSTGTWTKSGLSGDVIATPSKSGYVFTPSSRSVSGGSTTVDFTANVAPSPYSISGRVTTATGSGLADVTLSFSNNNSTVTSDAGGNWSKVGLTGSVTVTPTKAGWQFTPTSRQVTATDANVNFIGELTQVTGGIDLRWNTPPAAPTNLVPALENGAVLLTWRASGAGISGYDIYRASINDPTVSRMRNSTLISTNSFTDTRVESGKTYWYWVVAVSDSGLTSPFSQGVSVQLP